MKDLPLLWFFFLFLFLMWTTGTKSESDIIWTSSGPIQGSILGVKCRRVHEYLGIPYAQAPLGDLRFRKPQPLQPWSETLKANRMPPACIQYRTKPYPWYDYQPVNREDCLFLNMWVPETKNKNCCNKVKLSVMFWIHGGAFVFGSIRKPDYNGRALAAEGCVIVVTANYRLGAFGFFTANTDDAPANIAMFDVLAALKWTIKNIEAFGGDPHQVTVFGESGGSVITGLFCVSPLTKGLFNRAVMGSGCQANILFDDNTTSLMINQRLAEGLGCADPLKNILTSPDEVVDCMRKKDAFEIAKTLNSQHPNLLNIYHPIYGNEFLPNNIREDLKLGNFHDVSILVGNTRDEGSLLITSSFPEIFGFYGEKLSELNTSMAENMLKSFFNVFFKDIAGTEFVEETILGRLSTSDYRKNLKIVYDLVGDFSLVCPTVYFAESYSRYGKDVYFYFFEHRPSTSQWAKWMGVAHYDEVQFVFGSPVKQNNYSEEEVELSKLMMKMWSNFAKYGNPLHSEGCCGPPQSVMKLGKWVKYSPEMPLYLILDTTTRKAPRYNLGPQKVNCDLFRAINGFL